MIKIRQVNSVYVHIECPNEGIAMELREYFTFDAPNYQFHPLYKKKRWDGKIRLFSRKGLLYAGLMHHAGEFFEDRGYEYTIEAQESLPRKVSSEYLNQFIDALSPHSNGNPIIARDYQESSFLFAYSQKRGIIVSPTASGKSLIIYFLVMRWLTDMISEKVHDQKKILITVPTIGLVEQLYNDFCDYSAQNSAIDIESLVHRVYDGMTPNTNKPVVISTWQSIYKLPQRYFDQFSGIISDECHLCDAECMKSILTKLVHCPNRVGFTGTLKDSQTHHLVLRGLFGPVYECVTTRELIDDGTLANLHVKCIVMKYPKEDRKKIHKKPYPEEMEFLVSHPIRNKFIENLAITREGNTLVLFQYVKKHGMQLYQNIKDKYSGSAYFVYGEVEAEEREEIRKLVENNQNCIVVASYQTFSTGVNIKNLHNIIFASPSKSRVRVIQSIGRGLRVKEGIKESVVVYDISDDLTHNNHKNHTMNHLHERILIYNERQYDYTIQTIDIPDST